MVVGVKFWWPAEELKKAHIWVIILSVSSCKISVSRWSCLRWLRSRLTVLCWSFRYWSPLNLVIHNAYEISKPHALQDRRNVHLTLLIPQQEWRSDIIQALPFTCNGNDLGKEDLHLWRPIPCYEIALQSQHLQTPSRHLEQVTKNTPRKPSIIAVVRPWPWFQRPMRSECTTWESDF